MYTRYSICVCVCVRAREQWNVPTIYACVRVYASHTNLEVSPFHPPTKRASCMCVCVCVCLCRVYVLEPLNHTPHVSRTAAAGASIWVARLLVFSPIFFCYYLISPTAALAMAKREPMPSREVPIPRSSGARGSCRRSLASC